MADQLARIPPQNLEAEQGVLGALLIDRDAITRVADIVRAEDFYRDAHGQIFAAMLTLYEQHEPIDLVSLTDKLTSAGLLERVGGQSALAALANAVPTAAHVVSYARIVQHKATLRRLQQAAGKIAELGGQEDEDLQLLLDKAEQQLFNVSQNYLKQQFVPIRSVLAEAFERIDELHREGGKIRGLPTGYPDLDNILAGMQKSDLIILAARPSVGKTTLALDIARYAAVQQKAPVGIFSLEMSKEQLVDKLLCAQAEVDRLTPDLLAASRFLHANPELAYEEHKAAERLTAILEQHGFTVARGAAGGPGRADHPRRRARLPRRRGAARGCVGSPR